MTHLACRKGSTTAGTAAVAIILIVVDVRIIGVPISQLVVRVMLVTAAGIVITHDSELRAQALKIRAAAVVLQLAGDLDLLGLGSAAPHWLDPLMRGRARPLVANAPRTDAT
ncbi:hypothetical protein Pth03_71320 [Planotetraspora thailandica]|uniref:Uncharacterized protein n=1 Tax=Planotetraspora thailandica TaxID=487172 RepID=A0A8J3Y0T1_9ACTN|nr:hypothetical protein Pth03_71320 [Planotetraspora thailandica]